LAPVFAAGFAVQKLLEIFDALFSWTAHILANGAEGLPGAEEKKISNGKGDTTNNNILANGLKSISGKIKDAKAGIDANASLDETAKASETVKKANEEFEKSLKVLVIGLVSIGLACVIVSQLNISVMTPIFNLNATSGAAAKATSANYQGMDFWITVLFIAAGTEGINSILKYLGYAKEKKQGDAEGESGE
jgi:hypothetical protein